MAVLALDVGGTHIRSAWVEGTEVRDERRVHADLMGTCKKAGKEAEKAFLNALLEHIRGRLEEGGAQAVALGVPGFIDARGVVIASPNLPGVRLSLIHI